MDRDALLRELRGSGRPLRSASELRRALGLSGDASRGVRRVLETLVREAAVERVGRRYRLPRRDGLSEGVLSVGSEGARVVCDDGRALRVPDPGEARPGERVLVMPLSQGRGELLGVAEGVHDGWLGVLRREHRQGPAWVTPYRDDAIWSVRVGARDVGEADDGDVVVVTPSRRKRRRDGVPEGRVIEVLGPPGTPEADFRAVVWRRQLPVEFPPEALAEAEQASEAIGPGEWAGRLDLRELPFVTIDPETARDHDDAVCADLSSPKGARLWVAIADVAHFVRPGTALDREARRRGNSVYFPDRAIPMLPEALSSRLCSLLPERDRLVVAVELAVAGDGRARALGFHPAVIRSRARLAYAAAARAIETGEANAGVPGELVAQLRAFAGLARALGRRRLQRGSLDLEIPAARVVVDAEGRPLDVVPEARSVAHRAVEEAMLAANRAVASALVAAGVPAIHRNHEPPAEQDLAELRELLARLGLLGRRPAAELDTRELAAALERARGRREAALVHRAALRAMRLARYEATCRGHYALGFSHYLHFTSPIRRYADLTAARGLAALGAPGRAPLPDADELVRLAGRLSWLERRAEAAERERADLAKCALMAPRVGEEFDATLTGVAPHGLYVTLDAPFVEALVHVSRLPGRVHLDEADHALVATGSGRRFRIGDRLRVRLDAVDIVRARIDASLAPAPRERR